MGGEAIRIRVRPTVNAPICIVGFDGWGNALDVSRGLVSHLVEKKAMTSFADLASDLFYRYDDPRPEVRIEGGILKSLSMPGGQFFEGRMGDGEPDLLVLKADEPTLRWRRFGRELLDLLESVNSRVLFTVGAMYDQVLPSDRKVSAVVSHEALLRALGRYPVAPISYSGPSAVHGVLQAMGQRQGIDCVSLWAHCPYYIHGVRHYGLISQMIRIIGDFAGFEMDTQDLEDKWRSVSEELRVAAADSPKLQEIMDTLREDRKRGSLDVVRGMVDTRGKVVDLRDFFSSRDPWDIPF